MNIERTDRYCEIAFRSLNANIDLWKDNPSDKDTIRGVTRIYYDLVHALSIPSGFITDEALKKKKNNPKWIMCRDHCYSPQFVGRMMMDLSDIYLTDYQKFKKMWYLSCTTIEILSTQNKKLSGLTTNHKGNFKILVPTDKKYQHLNIQLVERQKGIKWYEKSTNSVSNYIETPKELLDYEKTFLVNSYAIH